MDLPTAAAHNKKTLFIFPGAGGNTVSLEELVSHLRKILDVVILHDEHDPFRSQVRSSTNLPEAYAARIMQEGGIIHLCGWCVGALVAHAVACQIQSRGGSVSSLFVLESNGPRAQESDGLLRTVLRKLKSNFSRANRILGKANPPKPHRHFPPASRSGKSPSERNPAKQLFYLRDIAFARTYKPGRFQGIIHIFWSTHDPDWDWIAKAKKGTRYYKVETAQHRWGKAVNGPLHITTIPGDHVTMLSGNGATMITEAIGRTVGCARNDRYSTNNEK